MYLIHAREDSPHYGVLRCQQHGFVKWLSQTQYQELSEIIYPQMISALEIFKD
jgi:hypothetical protein